MAEIDRLAEIIGQLEEEHAFLNAQGESSGFSRVESHIQEVKADLIAARHRRESVQNSITWQQEIEELIDTVRKTLPDLDEPTELENVLERGMLTIQADGRPQFRPEATALVALMRQCSDEIVKNAKSFDEMQQKAMELLPTVEQLAIYSVLRLTAAQMGKLRQIQAEIVKEAIEQFRPAFTSDFQFRDDESGKTIRKTATEQASEPASKHAVDIIIAIHPELSHDEAQARVAKVKSANLYDVHMALMLVFKKEGSNLDLEQFKAHLDNPDNMTYLPAERQQAMRDLYDKTVETGQPVLTNEERLDFIVLMEAIHISWAGSQFPRQKSGEDRFYREAYQQFPAIKVQFAQKDDELANLEVAKDLIHMS